MNIGSWEIIEPATNCNQKSIKLYMMLEQIQDHISSKPTSDRRAAVIKLGEENTGSY